MNTPHPITQLVEHRFTGALQAITALADRQTSPDHIQAIIDSRRESLRDHLDDRIIQEGTPTEIKSIQQEIGQMQALQELHRSTVSTKSLHGQYELELEALREALHKAPTKNSMWDPAIDRAIAPIERGYHLIDELGREERRLVNQLHGVAQPARVTVVRQNLAQRTSNPAPFLQAHSARHQTYGQLLHARRFGTSAARPPWRP